MSIPRYFLLLLLLWLFPTARTEARAYFNFHAKARQAYEAILSLRLQEAASILAQIRLNEPDNYIVYHLENYADFFMLAVRDDETAFRRMLPNRDRRLEKVMAGDDDSPYYLYIQAEIRLHWALLRLRFGDYWSAFSDINRAHKLLLRNQDRFPNFAGNKKDLGMLHAAVGTIPDDYKWAVELLSSLQGTVAQGRREMESALAYKSDYPYRRETQVIYAFLLLHLDNQPDRAWQVANDAHLTPQNNPLHCFVLSHIAMHTGRNDEALGFLAGRPTSSAFLSFPFLDYMQGIAKLRKLDTSGTAGFQRFISGTRGKHYVKEAYQKLAWAALLDGNETGYQRYMQTLLTKGDKLAGGDKNAQHEAESGQMPHPTLLRARLLFDGGYYTRADQLLAKHSVESFTASAHRLEYLYRRGRILHGKHSYEEALRFYNQTIERGRNSSSFHACNAALQAGLIEEKRRRRAEAARYFNLCLSLKPDEYRAGLHQQAKAGLARVQ